MRILIASMPILALLCIFALGVSARLEAKTNKAFTGTYLTPVLKRTLAKANQQRLTGWEVMPS